jgi:hypothetical protein
MPPFGDKKAKPATPAPAADVVPATPEQQLAALLAEQADIDRELGEHRTLRERWMVDGVGALDRLAEIAQGDDKLRQRAQELVALVADAQEAVRQERAAKRRAQWQTLAQDLEEAQAATAAAIRAYEGASERFRKLHWRATQAGYEAELRERFCSPPATQHNPWVFSQFVMAVEQRRQPRPMVVEATIIPAPSFGLRFPRDPWKPLHDRRVPPDLIEAISPLAPDRQVRFLHRVNIFKVQPGYATVEAGTEMWLSARAAFACNYVGAAEYIDVAQSAEAPAA